VPGSVRRLFVDPRWWTKWRSNFAESQLRRNKNKTNKEKTRVGPIVSASLLRWFPDINFPRTTWLLVRHSCDLESSRSSPIRKRQIVPNGIWAWLSFELRRHRWSAANYVLVSWENNESRFLSTRAVEFLKAKVASGRMPRTEVISNVLSHQRKWECWPVDWELIFNASYDKGKTYEHSREKSLIAFVLRWFFGVHCCSSECRSRYV